MDKKFIYSDEEWEEILEELYQDEQWREAMGRPYDAMGKPISDSDLSKREAEV